MDDFSQRSQSGALAVWLAAGALLLVGSALWRVPSKWDGPGDPSPELEQALADAILTSLMSLKDESVTAESVQARFVRALELAPDSERARIYLFLGESQSGMPAFGRTVDKIFKKIDKDGPYDLDADLSELLLQPQAQVEACIRRSLSKLPSRCPLPQHNRRTPIEREFAGESDFAEQCYVAAVAENPGYLPAWSKLALTTEGELRGFALREWIACDRRNALPLFFLAAHVAEESPEQAVALLHQGAMQPRCTIPRPQLPQSFTLTYPDTTIPRELSLVGQPVTATALANHYEILNPPFLTWRHPASDLRQLGRTLHSNAETDCCSMEKPACAKVVPVLHRAGCRLLANDDGDFQLTFAGMAILWLTEELLIVDPDPLVQQWGQRLRTTGEEFSEDHIRPWIESVPRHEDNVPSVVSETIDYRAHVNGSWRRMVEESQIVDRLQSIENLAPR
jgi:hypothetical protein